MGTLTVIASFTGFLAAHLFVGMYSEQIADIYIDAYEQGFYLTSGAPAATAPLALTPSEKNIVAKYCEMPADQTLALDMETTAKPDG
ncbi:MAG: hypothetical protein HQ481_16030 [Alphaproteobacteria bacterium]|nr:hypothetical protein [Alphaproteobacteria bacterium]